MKITIEKLLPIARGSFELRPLTIFIGPNNTGKTRAALVAYAFCRALTGPPSTFVQSQATRAVQEHAPDYDFRVADGLDELRLELSRRFDTAVCDRLPELLQSYLGFALGAEAQNAEQPTHQNSRLSFSTSSSNALELVGLTAVTERPKVEITGDAFPPAQRWLHERQHRPESFAEWDDPVAEAYWLDILARFGWLKGKARYLASSRGALLTLFTFYVDTLLRGSGGSDNRDLLPAMVRDYLQELNRSASRLAAAKGVFNAPNSAIDLIEKQIMKGRISIAGPIASPGAFVYSNIFDEGKSRVDLPMSSVSSSIAEIGPIAVALKTIVEPGDLVIIDEPEAHLHPSNQRRMAQALVRLANAGVTVLAPTHSSTIVHQVSNLVRAHTLLKTDLRKLGLENNDTLRPDQVGVYAFKQTADGVEITEVAYDNEFGYPEEAFFDVSVRITNESYALDTLLAPVAPTEETSRAR